MTELKISKHYNLSVFANSILGSTYANVKLLSILGYETALKFASIDLLHKQVYPYLPPGTPADHTEYTYYMFESQGKTIILADYWIVPGSVEETEGVNYTIKLNNITAQELSVVRDQLRLLGLNFSIS